TTPRRGASRVTTKDHSLATAMRKIPVERTRRYEDEGWWTQDTLGDLIARGLQASPDAGFHVHSAVRPFAGTFHDVETQARRLAAGLRTRGVGPGDVVAMQLPNWMEAAATVWASTFLGAVTVPIVHFYGRKELTHILGTAKPRVFIPAQEFGRMQFLPDLCADIPIVGLVGADVGAPPACGGRSREEHQHRYDELLAAEPLGGTLAADPASPALIAFTSGTTSNPKGVVHSHQTLGFETRQLLENYPAERGRQLTATPVGHFIGMLAAFLIPVLEGAPIDLCDVWAPGNVLKLIERDGFSIGGGPPYFVTSLLDHPDCTPEHMSHFTTVGLGGSTVPAAVTRRLADLGIFVFRSYGSSEHPPITGSPPSAPEDKRLHTDRTPRQVRRRGRVVPPRRRRGARRGRLPHHHRPQGRRHHPRRREHQPAGGRGAAAQDAGRSGGCGGVRTGHPAGGARRSRPAPQAGAADAAARRGAC